MRHVCSRLLGVWSLVAGQAFRIGTKQQSGLDAVGTEPTMGSLVELQQAAGWNFIPPSYRHAPLGRRTQLLKERIPPVGAAYRATLPARAARAAPMVSMEAPKEVGPARAAPMVSMAVSVKEAPNTVLKQWSIGDLDLLLKHEHPLVVGLSIHSGTVDKLEKLSIPAAEWNAAAKKITSYGSIKEAAVLSTCNRFELYLVGKDDSAMLSDVLDFLQERSGLSKEALYANLFVLPGSDASQHLLEVASGLDSVVLGEGQILSQVKNMYAHAISAESDSEPAGSAGTVLKRMLKDAVEAGKMVRSATNISRGAVSVSSAAAELAAIRAPEDVGGPLAEQRITVLGAGEMSELLLKHLASNNIRKVTLLSRTQARSDALAAKYPQVDIDVRSVDQLWQTLAETDVLFSAVSVSDLITKEKVQELERSSPIMFVDISLPRSIAKDCSEVDGVFSYDVGDLKGVVAANTAQRAEEVVKAKTLLNGFRMKFVDWVCSMDYIQSIGAFRARFEGVRQEECDSAFSAKPLSELSEKQRDVVEGLTKEIMNKLLDPPTRYMRSGTARRKLSVQQLEDIFNFDRAAAVLLKIDAKAKEDVMSLDAKVKNDLLLIDGFVRGEDSPRRPKAIVAKLRRMYEERERKNRENWARLLKTQFAPADALARKAVLYLDGKAQKKFRELDQRARKSLYNLEASFGGEGRAQEFVELVEREREQLATSSRKLDSVQRIMRLTESMRAEVMEKALRKGLASFSDEQQAAVLELSYILVAKFIGPLMVYEEYSGNLASTGNEDDLPSKLDEVFQPRGLQVA